MPKRRRYSRQRRATNSLPSIAKTRNSAAVRIWHGTGSELASTNTSPTRCRRSCSNFASRCTASLRRSLIVGWMLYVSPTGSANISGVSCLLSRTRTNTADAVTAILRGRRLQLQPSGPVRRSSVPPAIDVFLSRRERDYTGGEFLLVEQRPRAQSRGEAITTEQGEMIIFTTRFRPARGTRGYHRVQMRHGVNAVTSGTRYTLGVIFHNAK